MFIILFSTFILNSQITLQGCSSALSDQDYTLVQTSTTYDQGIIRNTFETLPLTFDQPCTSGFCELRMIWSIENNRWEIQLDNNPSPNPNYNTAILYYNTSNSYPNPPSLNMGTWVDNLGAACGGDNSITTLTGDVQDSVLATNLAFLSEISIYPNPIKDIIYIKNGTGTSLEKITISDINGREIMSFTFNDYFYEKKLDVSLLESGFYLLHIISKKGIGTKKLIVQ